MTKQWYKIEKLIELLSKQGYVYWSDEHCIMRPLESFITIFYSKYAVITSGFSFQLVGKNPYKISAQNIDGFEYRFPVLKKQ